MATPQSTWDVVVVGAGPTGSHTARGFAKAGLRTALLEEHAEIGLPVHCTGVVGHDLLERFPQVRQVVWRAVDEFKVFSPEGNSFPLPNVAAYVLNRRDLDLLLAGEAQKEGAELFLSHKAISVNQTQHGVHLMAQADGEEIHFQSKILVLATGSTSHLPKRSSLAEPPQFIRGVQVEVEIEGLSCVELYLGGHVAPGSFAWAVPTHGQLAKAGLITIGNARIYLDKLFESPFLKSRLKRVVGKPLVSRIPLGAPRTTVNHRILAVGDAAGQVKTSTGGGIYYGLLGAEELLSCALGAYKESDFVPSLLQSYHSNWRKKLGLELQAGLYIRRVFEKIEDRDINRLIRLFERRELRDLVGRYANFDRHRDLIFALTKVPDVRAIMVDLIKRNFPYQSLFSAFSTSA